MTWSADYFSGPYSGVLAVVRNHLPGDQNVFIRS